MTVRKGSAGGKGRKTLLGESRNPKPLQQNTRKTSGKEGG